MTAIKQEDLIQSVADTKDNTPAVVHFDLVPGDLVEVRPARASGKRESADFRWLRPDPAAA